MKQKYFLYKTTNLINNKIYIGVHFSKIQSKKIVDNYLGSGKLLKLAIKKYGKENFKREILKYFDNIQNLLEAEKRIVNEEFVRRRDTYNIRIGGDGFPGCVTVRDENNKLIVITKTDPRYVSGELKSWIYKRVFVKDKDGNIFDVHNEDPRYLSGEFISLEKNKIIVKDKEGNKFKIDKNDPRYISGEFVHHLKGTQNNKIKNKVMVKDKNNKCLFVDKNDPRYISGELKGIAKNKIIVVDKNGNKFQVNKNDPRYISGELKFWAHKGTTNNKKWMHNKKEQKSKFVDIEDIQNFIDIGWELGRLKKKD